MRQTCYVVGVFVFDLWCIQVHQVRQVPSVQPGPQVQRVQRGPQETPVILDLQVCQENKDHEDLQELEVCIAEIAFLLFA